MKHSRRKFIQCVTAAAAAAGISEFAVLRGLSAPVESSGLRTFTDWITADRETRKAALQQCLTRIRELDSSIHAWVVVQPERPTGDGPLSEIPFGAKDIIETKGMATEYGSPLYKGRVGTADAAIIRDLRGRGAILLGKTVTTAFAYRTPGPTRNPRNLDHTPGGSSSGSAAAIAADMVPFAVGEQTRGSMLRPASFCGVTGFKPTYDLLPTEGMLPFAKSLDTLGLYTHTPADMIALWKAMGKPVAGAEEFRFAAAAPIPECDPDMANAFRQSIGTLRRSGITIQSVDIAPDLKKLIEASDVLEAYEGAREHEARLKQFGEQFDQNVANVVREGLKIPAERYDEAKRFIAGSRIRFAEIFKTTPVILTPAAVGAAPLGLSTTGDARMNAPWTALGTPAVSIPMPVGGGLPLGLQLTADLNQDARILPAALRLYEHLSVPSK